jgi:hypothetical protein
MSFEDYLADDFDDEEIRVLNYDKKEPNTEV